MSPGILNLRTFQAKPYGVAREVSCGVRRRWCESPPSPNFIFTKQHHGDLLLCASFTRAHASRHVGSQIRCCLWRLGRAGCALRSFVDGVCLVSSGAGSGSLCTSSGGLRLCSAASATFWRWRQLRGVAEAGVACVSATATSCQRSDTPDRPAPCARCGCLDVCDPGSPELIRGGFGLAHRAPRLCRIVHRHLWRTRN